MRYLDGITDSIITVPIAQTVKLMPTMKETQIRSLGQEIPWRRKWQPTPVFLPGESHGRRSLVGFSSGGRKESNTTERLNLDSQTGVCGNYQGSNSLHSFKFRKGGVADRTRVCTGS